MAVVTSNRGSTGVDDLLAAEVMTGSPDHIGEDGSFLSAWERMAARGVHHLPVVDRDGRYRGMVDAAGLAAAWPGGGPVEARRPVSVLLRDRRFPRVRAGDPVRAVAAAMVGARADAVAVTGADGRLTGIITVRDLLLVLARDRTPGPEQAPDRARGGTDARHHPGASRLAPG